MHPGDQLFGGRPIGEEWLRLFDLRFRIIGVFREGVESAAALEMSEAAGLTAVMPFSTLKNLGNVTDVDTVYIQATSPEAVPGVVQGVREILAAQHHSIDNFTIQSLDRYLTVVEQISDGITLGPDSPSS